MKRLARLVGWRLSILIFGAAISGFALAELMIQHLNKEVLVWFFRISMAIAVLTVAVVIAVFLENILRRSSEGG